MDYKVVLENSETQSNVERDQVISVLRETNQRLKNKMVQLIQAMQAQGSKSQTEAGANSDALKQVQALKEMVLMRDDEIKGLKGLTRGGKNLYSDTDEVDILKQNLSIAKGNLKQLKLELSASRKIQCG